MSAVLITHFFPRYKEQAEFFAMTCEFNKAVCDKIGWRFVADSKRRVPDKNIWREKSAICHEVICGEPDGERAVWIDGDVLLIGSKLDDIFTEIEGYDYGMAKPFGRWNAGVVPMFVSPQMRTLWADMRDHTHKPPAGTLDDPAEWTRECPINGDRRSIIQGASETWDANVCDTCPVPAEKRGPLCGSHKVKLALIGLRWNQKPKDVDENTQIIGFHRDTGYSKVRKIREAIQRATR